MGIAVFKDGKMVGELTGIETICHLITSGKLTYCILQIKNPTNDNKNVNIKVQLRNKPNTKVYLINGTPYIDEKINLKVDLMSVEGNEENLTNKNNSEKLEVEINSYLQKLIYNYLYKVSKEYETDIDGYGKYATKYFKTEDEFDKYNWINNYKNSFFNITINSKITSSSNLNNS